MKWVEANYLQITGVFAVIILLAVGRSALLPAIRSMGGGAGPGGSRPGGARALLLWVAWVVTGVCGLVLGWALAGVMGWLIGLPGTVGGVIGSVGAVAALLAGWHSVLMLIAMIRDLADGTPDDEARQAALWVPTLLPAGWSAVAGVISRPSGGGTGLVAAIMAAVTVVYAHRIINAALKGRTGSRAWAWFASLVAFFAGVVLLPLLAYLDAWVAGHVSTELINSVRTLLGVTGVGLAIAALVDIAKDRKPDQHVRRFFAYGIPLLFMFWSLAAALIGGGAQDGWSTLVGAGR